MKKYERILVISDRGLPDLLLRINEQYPNVKLIQIIPSPVSRDYYYAVLEKETEQGK